MSQRDARTPVAATKPRRRFIVRLKGGYEVPKEWEPIRVLAVEQEQDGAGANFHHVYVCLCEEVDLDG